MDYVGVPYIPSNAARKTRLIGFDASYAANGYKLKPEHTVELDKLVAFVSRTSEFSLWIVGYASKAGDHHANQTLSANRALSVETYLKSQNGLFGDDERLDVRHVGEVAGHLRVAALPFASGQPAPPARDVSPRRGLRLRATDRIHPADA